MTASLFQQHKFIFIFAGAMVAMGILYFAYRLADGAFIAEQEATGSVLGKEYVPAHEKYRTQNVGGVNRALKITVGNAWFLEIDLGGVRARAEVDHSEFEKMRTGTVVGIRFKKRRISGTIQVTQYLGKTGG
jgi:hypothetical protein